MQFCKEDNNQLGRRAKKQREKSTDEFRVYFRPFPTLLFSFSLYLDLCLDLIPGQCRYDSAHPNDAS